MTAVVILNVVLAVFLVGGIVTLLGRAIIADNPGVRLRLRQPAPAKPARSPRRGATDAAHGALAART